MSNSELMLSCITGGMQDDGTTSAALDAIRDESGCTLFAAVLEVARVWNSTRAARELADAAALLAKSSPVREQLERSILAECLNVPTGSLVTIVTVEGEQWPRANVKSSGEGLSHLYSACVTVGALWVKREATSIQIHCARSEKPKRRRASR